jgi:hypothetical protein
MARSVSFRFHIATTPVGPHRKHPADADRNTGCGRHADNMKTKTNIHPLNEIGIPATAQSRKSGPHSTLILSYRVPRIALMSLLLVGAPAVQAQEEAAELEATEFVEPNIFEKIWGYATLYKDDLNPILQEFKLRGRYQGQYWDVDADQGSQSHWEDRRSRFGFDAKLFEKEVEVRADFQSNDQFVDFYDGLVDAYVRWKPKTWISFTAGKTKPLIGQYDWLEPTITQPTFERSQIFNQLNINRATALTVDGTTDAWSWRAGIYSNDTPANTTDPITKETSGSFGDGEFGDLNGGIAGSVGVGYDFKHLLDLEKADFRIDWLHSDREKDDLVLGRYDDIVSSTFWIKEGYAAVVFEAYYATGGDPVKQGADKKLDNSDVFGFFIQPTYDIIPQKLQLVGRYSYANSDGLYGVQGQSRYERKVTTKSSGGVGDSYQSLYGGAQYFIHGDKLKLMAGAEWAELNAPKGDSYDGITLLSGIRLSF